MCVSRLCILVTLNGSIIDEGKYDILLNNGFKGISVCELNANENVIYVAKPKGWLNRILVKHATLKNK